MLKRLLAQPLSGEPVLASGPSGCAGFAGLMRVCTDEPAFKALRLDRKSRVLLISSEGNLGEGSGSPPDPIANVDSLAGGGAGAAGTGGSGGDAAAAAGTNTPAAAAASGATGSTSEAALGKKLV